MIFMGESTKSWLVKYWPFATQIGLWLFLAGMAWSAFQQTREEQRMQSTRIEAIESRIREGEKADQAKSEVIARLEVNVNILIFEVQQLRRRLEDKKIVFQAGSDNSSVVGGTYNERP